MLKDDILPILKLAIPVVIWGIIGCSCVFSVMVVWKIWNRKKDPMDKYRKMFGVEKESGYSAWRDANDDLG